MIGTIAVSLSACNAAPEIGGGACDQQVAPRVARPLLAAGPTPVIIRFARDVDLASLAAGGRARRAHMISALVRDAERAQADTLALLNAHGIAPDARLWLINGLAATVPAPLLDELARLPGVSDIGPDVPMRAPLLDRHVAATSSWNLSALRAPELWASGVRGDGAVVAVLDGGVDVAHPDLAPTWRANGGWFDPYGQHPGPFDQDGHGTMVAGLVVGGNASGTPTGVAPHAQWIAAKIYDDAGTASLAAIHASLQWVLDPDGDPWTDDAADVVVASWGFTELVNECFAELEPDLAVLRAAQIVPVFPAGNTGPFPDSSISPGNNPSALSVGAIDQSLAVSSTSARGPGACTGTLFPTLVAPGVNVRSTDRTLGGQLLDSYSVVSGTSFAAPHIAGALALLRGAHPEATASELEDSLTGTAIDLSPTGPDVASGFGLPDVVAADARLAGRVPGCTDRDGDGYVAEPNCGTALDCSDDAPEIHPGACDSAGDGIDQDCDGVDR